MIAGFTLKLISSILIIATGALMFIMGISDAFYCGGYYVSHKSYGGDAYTGIQNAAADTANNIESVGGLIADVANASMFFLGLLLIALGLFLLGKAIYQKSLIKNMTAGAPAAAPMPQAPAYQPTQAPAYQQPQYQPPRY